MSQIIRIFPDPVLRKPAEPVTDFGKKTVELAQKMHQIMKSQTHGIGIAAPQIGVSRRMAIVDVSSRMPGAKKLVLINPEILDAKDEQPSREGCMSVPDYTGLLRRYFWIKFKWQDETGAVQQKISTGIEAVCIQHEIDHLSGMLFIDRVGSLKKDLIPRRLKGR
jgi:peptide deformylase